MYTNRFRSHRDGRSVDRGDVALRGHSGDPVSDRRGVVQYGARLTTWYQLAVPPIGTIGESLWHGT